MALKDFAKSFEECLIFQDVIVRGKGAKGEGSSLLEVLFFCDCKENFFGNCIVKLTVEMIEVKGGIAVFLSEHSGDGNIFEFVVEEGPFVVESDHSFDTFFMLLLERCGGAGLRG